MAAVDASVTGSASPKALQSIHFLRGLAAVFVVLAHALGSTSLKFPQHVSILPGSFESQLVICASSVDFFFLISGFTMFYVYAKDFGNPLAWRDFMVRRVIRIVPMYWLITAIYVAGLLFVPSAFSTLKFQLRHAIESFLFIPTSNSAGEHFPMLNVGWTLWFEMYFYLLFGLAMLRTVRFALWAMGIFFGLSVLIGYVAPLGTPVLEVLFNQLVFEFFLGGLAGYLALRGYRASVPIAWALLASGLAIFAIQFVAGEWHIGRLFTRGVPALMILIGLVSLEQHGRFKSPDWAIRLGDECYSLYLTHSLVLALIFKAYISLELMRWVSPDALIVLCLLAAVIAAHVVFVWLERPLTAALNSAWRDWGRLRVERLPRS